MKRLFHLVRKLYKLIFDDFKNFFLFQYFPKKPIVINLNANDICNSKCTMCNIWQQKQEFEFSPEQLEDILKNELFSEVQHVGITGGEPTLREDLPALYEACCKALPKLVGLSIITNAIKEKDVISRIEQVQKVCEKYGKNFSMMVSLDGYAKVHERVRGREGNFKSAIRVIKYFKENTNIPVSIGCTISKENVWGADELLDFMKEEGIYGRFRVAEYIKRLYNDDRNEVIRNFSADELYQLASFFKKLELTFEKNPVYKRTYRSIHNMLLGGKRTIGCPFQTEGIVLNSKGEIHYCAPKSAKIGDGLKESAWDIYRKNLKERRRIVSDECADCIHDYHAPLTFREFLQEKKEKFWKKIVALDSLKNRKKFLFIRLLAANYLVFKVFSSKKTKKVFVVGWYGTETVGDKAILGGIIKNYQKNNPETEFIIGSLEPFITERTMQELGIKAKVINDFSSDFIKYSILSNDVVMGGGPLMHINELFIPQLAFALAKLAKNKRVIFGCGIGPLGKEKYTHVVKDILANATDISLRDTKSISIAKEWTGRNGIQLFGDPAKPFVLSRSQQINPEPAQTLACFLREWDYLYCGGLPYDEYLNKRTLFEKGLAEYIKQEAKTYGLVPAFYSMHNYFVGYDDREFYRRFIKTYFQGEKIIFNEKLATVDNTISSMKSAEKAICMRFHSVLFAETLKIDFKAIDYTEGGKIYSFLKDQKQLDRLLTINDFVKVSSVE